MARRGYIQRLAKSALQRFGYVSKADLPRLPMPMRGDVARMDTTLDKLGTAGQRGGLTTMANLRAFAERCDVVANAIQLRIDQVRSTPLEIVPLEEFDEEEVKGEIAQADEFISTPGGLGGPGVTRQEFLCSAIYDLLTIGCCAIYRRQNKGGKTFSAELVDGASIKPLLTSGGWMPQPPEIAFEQYNPTTQQKIGPGFRADEMRYVRYNSRLTSRYGRSPTENVLIAILQYIAYDVWNLSWATDGDADFTYWEVPDSWNFEQIARFESLVNTLNVATAGRQVQAKKTIPVGPKRVRERPIKEASFEKTQVHLVRRIARAFGLSATVLGFEGAQYKVAQEAATQTATIWGEDVTKLLLADLLTDILHDDLGLTRVRAQWREREKDKEPIARMIASAGTAFIAPNDGREMLGLPAAEGPYMDAYFLPSQFGPVVLGWRPGTKPPSSAAPLPPPEATPTPEVVPLETTPLETIPAAAKAGNGQAAQDLAKWERLALKRLREGHVAKATTFTSAAIPIQRMSAIVEKLTVAKSAEQVRAAFATNGDDEALTEAIAARMLQAVREERERRKPAEAQ